MGDPASPTKTTSRPHRATPFAIACASAWSLTACFVKRPMRLHMGKTRAAFSSYLGKEPHLREHRIGNRFRRHFLTLPCSHVGADQHRKNFGHRN